MQKPRDYIRLQLKRVSDNGFDKRQLKPT
jgi:hypothetical protein